MAAPNFSRESSASLTTSNVTLTLDADGAGSSDLAQRCHLGVATLWLTSVVTATTVTWYISADADGDQAITPMVTDTIFGQTAGSGSVVRSIDIPFVGTGPVYIQATLDAGTATAEARLYWRL